MDGDELTRGLSTAVDQAKAEADGADDEVARVGQMALFPAECLDDLPTSELDRRAALRATGPGRPKGATNKRTNDWKAYILARYRHPMEFLAETFSRSPHDLARELDCKPAEAYAVQAKCAAELLPYLEGKAPVQLQVDANLASFSFVLPEVAEAYWAAKDKAGPVLMDGPVFDMAPETEEGGNE
ncbi:MAG: hypothetical protein H7Y60_09210 [Rhodospirillaceae bacterium]|nr:hypothetical protein [Rhodospirillales bacterium]